MEPKSKNFADFAFPLIGAILAIYIAMQMAVSYEIAMSQPIIKEKFTSDGLVQTEKINITLFLNDFSERFDKYNEITFVQSTPRFLVVSSAIYLLLLAYFVTSRRKLIRGREYGTADWAKPADIFSLTAKGVLKDETKKLRRKLFFRPVKRKNAIKSLKRKMENADMILTATERISIYNYQISMHSLILGGSGSGKTRSYVLPNILQAHSSYIVTDPKGEILEKCGHFLVKRGYKLRVLNLDNKRLSFGYNPFRYIHRNRDGWEERVLTLIDAIIMNTDGEAKKGSTDPFWDKAERLFLQSLFFFTVEGFPEEQCNMNTVMELISMLELHEEKDDKTSDLDFFVTAFANKYGEGHIGVQQFREFRGKASGKTAKSIVISAVSRLAPFRISEIKRIFTYDQMELESVGEEKTAIFVVVPPTDKTFNFIAGMLFTQLFQEINYCALTVHRHDGQRLPVPCRFILDEFATTCKIPNFVSILAYARSLGCGITTILQSLEQIKHMYKDEWGTIVDNSNTLLYLGKVTHMETLEYLSKLLGKATYDKESTSRTKGQRGSTSKSYDKIGRELLDASEIRKIQGSKCLLFVEGRNAFYSKKFDYTTHPHYMYTSDGTPAFSYSYSPPKVELPHSEEVKSAEKKSSILSTIDYGSLSFSYGDDALKAIYGIPVEHFEFDEDAEFLVNDGELDDLSAYSSWLEEERKAEQQNDMLIETMLSFNYDLVSNGEQASEFMKNESLYGLGTIDFDDAAVSVNDGEPEVFFDYDAAGEVLNKLTYTISGTKVDLINELQEFTGVASTDLPGLDYIGDGSTHEAS